MKWTEVDDSPGAEVKEGDSSNMYRLALLSSAALPPLGTVAIQYYAVQDITPLGRFVSQRCIAKALANPTCSLVKDVHADVRPPATVQ